MVLKLTSGTTAKGLTDCIPPTSNSLPNQTKKISFFKLEAELLKFFGLKESITTPKGEEKGIINYEFLRRPAPYVSI